MKIQINLTNSQNIFKIDNMEFEQKAIGIVQQIFKQDIFEKSPLIEYDFENKEINIDIVLCDNEQIQVINKDYRSKDFPTDVITFALFADESPQYRIVCENEIHLGEIIISLEKIAEQAKENNKSFKNELYFILAHGILHLFGFVHDDEKKLEFMIKIQEQLIV